MELTNNTAKWNPSPGSGAQCYTPNYGLGGEGGAVVLQQSRTNITETNFTSNGAAALGGAVVVQDVYLQILDSTFNGNRAGHQGGAIAVQDGSHLSNIIANNVRFTTNQQSQHQEHCRGPMGEAPLPAGGGAVSGSAKHRLQMNHVQFLRNSAVGLVSVHQLRILWFNYCIYRVVGLL